MLLLLLITLTFAQLYPKPTWPETYAIKATWSLPYGDGVNMPLQFVYNKDCGTKAIWYGGLKTSVQNLANTQDYETIVEKDHLTCFEYEYGYDYYSSYYEEEDLEIDTEELMKAFLKESGSDFLTNILPDLTDYSFGGYEACPPPSNGICDRWVYSSTTMGKQSNYTMLVYEKVPMQFDFYGYNDIFHSHFDHYRMSYETYSPRSDIRCSTFDEPDLCATSDTHGEMYEGTQQLRTVFKSALEHRFHAFMEKHERVYDNYEEYVTRMGHFAFNEKYIDSVNQRGLSYKLGMNHLGDRSHEEMQSIKGLRRPNPMPEALQPLHVWRGNGQDPQFLTMHPDIQKKLKNYQWLNESLDWREFGAVTAVKDQAQCGSCWTFGSSQSLEGTMFLKTNVLEQYSEQYIVDCAWTQYEINGDMVGSEGCGGGWGETAFNYARDNGGIPTTSSYGPYLGVNDYCRPDSRLDTAKLSGYVAVETGNIGALLNSIQYNGPHYIALDASQDDFSFYMEGVYSNPKCKNDLDHLDHAVLLVGYGTDPLYGEYWVVKNSWSTYWGDQGYIKIAREDNLCGIATNPIIPVVE